MARIPYVDVDAAPARVREVLSRLPRPLNIFRLVAHAESALRPAVALGAAILGRSTLDPALRELAILRVASLSGAAYEWDQHEALALAVGVAPGQIEAVRSADWEAESLSVLERQVLDFVESVVVEVRASDQHFEPVRRALGDRALVELVLTIGYYMMLARVMVNFDVDDDPPLGQALLDSARRRPNPET